MQRLNYENDVLAAGACCWISKDFPHWIYIHVSDAFLALDSLGKSMYQFLR